MATRSRFAATAASHHRDISTLPTSAYEGDKVTSLSLPPFYLVTPSNAASPVRRCQVFSKNTPETLTDRPP